MFDKMELMVYASVLEKVNVLEKDVKKYKELIYRKVVLFGKKKRLAKRQSVIEQIADLVDVVIQYPEIFNNSHTKDFHDEMMGLLNYKFDLSDQFSDDLSFLDILKHEKDYRVGKNANLHHYVPLANHIPDRAYFQLYELIRIIVLFTKRTLEEDELDFVEGNDVQFKWK